MRKYFPSILILLLVFGLGTQDAAARGFGGGRGFGMRSNSIFSNFSRSKQSNRTVFSKNPRANKWRGALGGLLVGSLLANLFMGHGLGSALLSWLALGFVISFIINFIRRRQSAIKQ